MSQENQDKPFDHALKLVFQREPGSLLALVDPKEKVRSIQLEATELKLHRLSDGVARVRSSRGSYVFHLEFEGNPRKMPLRMLTYNVLLQLQLKGHPPVRSVLILLKKPPSDFSETIEAALPGGTPYLRYAFEALHLYAIPAASLAENPAFAQLAPLGAGFAGNKKAIVARAATVIRQHSGEERVERLGILSLLARAKKLSEKETQAIISLAEVKMSLAYQEILNEGRQEGRQEGRIEEAQDLVQRLLLRRFGVHHGLEPLLKQCDQTDLEWLFDEALSTDQLPLLQKKLEARLKGRS